MQADIDFKGSNEVLRDLNNPFLVNELNSSQLPSDFLNADGSLKSFKNLSIIYENLANDCGKADFGFHDYLIVGNFLGGSTILSLFSMDFLRCLYEMLFTEMSVNFSHIVTMFTIFLFISLGVCLFIFLNKLILDAYRLKKSKDEVNKRFQEFEAHFLNLLDSGYFQKELSQWSESELKSDLIEKWIKKRVSLDLGVTSSKV